MNDLLLLRDDIACLLFAHSGKPRKRRLQQVEAVGKRPPPSDPAAWRCCHFQVLDTAPQGISTGTSSQQGRHCPCSLLCFTSCLRRQPWFFWREGVQKHPDITVKDSEAAERPGSLAHGVLSTRSWWSAILLTPRTYPEKMRTIRRSSCWFPLAIV